MSYLISFATQFSQLCKMILAQQSLHGRWLNTLSFLENCGARKIAACEHPIFVKEEMLKHAAEEFRHAHYLKRQLGKLDASFVDYSLPHLLGGWQTIHYLDRLNVMINRELLKYFPEEKSKLYAYSLVTYAIELRANEVYQIYQQALKQISSKVSVTSILSEEKEHLREMEEEVLRMPNGVWHAQRAAEQEAQICQPWLKCIAAEINQQLR